MRIVGYIKHPTLKITIFQSDNRLSVKFETGLYEQTYKFRPGEAVDKPEDVEKLVDEVFIDGVLKQFAQMHQLKNEGKLRAFPPTRADEFEQII